jgi:hypothetical protein
MKRFINKRVMALALAVIMSVSLFALSASATSPEIGVNPSPNVLLWYADQNFATWWPSSSSGPKLTAYGYDTLQEIVYTYGTTPEDDTIDFVLHPQYYHNPNDPIDWEEPKDAIASFEIISFEVWDESAYAYVPLVNNSTSAEYVLYNVSGAPYLQCYVSAVYTDLINPNVKPVLMTWNAAYLQIPDGVIPEPDSVI